MALLRELGEGVHLWVVSLDSWGSSDSLYRVLSPREQRRAERFRLALHARRYVVGRAAVRVLLGKELDLPADEVPLTFGPHGKPQLASAMRLEFNVSHCDHIAVVALARDAAIGVDVERNARVRGAPGIATRFFDTYEADAITRLPASLAEAAFVRCWTSKEAVLKATGVGLSEGLRSVVVEPDPRLAPCLIRVPRGGIPSMWTLHELALWDSRMAIAVAVAAPAVKLGSIRPFRWASRSVRPPGIGRSKLDVA